MSRYPATHDTTQTSTVLPFDARRRGGIATKFDPRRRAKLYVSMLEGMRHDGTYDEVASEIHEISKVAALTASAGESSLAAQLYMEAALTLHAAGMLEPANELLQAAQRIEGYIGSVIHDITRLRASIALDRGNLDEAVTQIRRADRPVLVRSATIVHDPAAGSLLTRLDNSEAGEQVRENEGKVTNATLLIEAEIMMSRGDQHSAAAALSLIHQNIRAADVAVRVVDEMAMLALLRTLAHDIPHAGSVEVLEGLSDTWGEKGASPQVVARIHAAAARPQRQPASINAFEYTRFARLGEAARESRARPAAPAPAPAVFTAPPADPAQPAQQAQPLYELDLTAVADADAATSSADESQATAPPAANDLMAARADEDDDEQPLDLSDITNETIESLLDSLPSGVPTPAPTADEAPAEVARQAAASRQQPDLATARIGPDDLELYSVISSHENNRRTGSLRFECNDMWAVVYFQQGRIVFAEHHSNPETPFEAFQRISEWCETTDERIALVFTRQEALDVPLTLSTMFHSNASLLLHAVTGLSKEEGEEPAAEAAAQTPTAAELDASLDIAFADPSQPAPSANSLNANTGIPSDVVNAFDSVLESKNIQELVTRLAEHVQNFGAKGVRVQVFVGSRATVVASYPPAEEQDPPARTVLVESAPGTATNLRVAVEASEAPPEKYLPSLFALARAARFACETLPAREKSRVVAPPQDGEAESAIVWASEPMFDVMSVISQLAPMDGVTLPNASVLITGETGTGKDMIARHIHDKSGRRDGQFVVVNCAAIPTDLFASTIFGYRKGAFTGAAADTPGLLENADGGTIFFNEFAEIPSDVQAKLLTVMDPGGQFFRVGEAHVTRRTNVRFIFATHRNVTDAEILRTDIFHRCPGKIHLKPLRERREDIPPLARHFASEFGIEITDAAVTYLQHDLDWPGNIRELRSVLQMSLSVGEGPLTPERVRAAWLRAYPDGGAPATLPDADPRPLLEHGVTIKEILDRHEKAVWSAALDRCGGVEKVVGISGFSANTVYTRMEKHGLTTRKKLVKPKKTADE